MDPRFRMEVTKFNAAMREMQARLRDTRTIEQVIDYEVSKIIERAMTLTTAATVAGICDAMTNREWTTLLGKRYKLSHRYPDRVWRAIVEKRKATLLRKLAARGLGKRSWLELARLLGFNISAPGFVQQARRPSGSGGQENVNVQRSYTESAYGLQITNASPINQWSDAKQAFFSAVVGRRKFYEQNLKRAVFDDLAKVAKKYPGLVVKS